MRNWQFRLKIELGNETMKTNDDVANALQRLAALVPGYQNNRVYLIWDSEGNTVGECKFRRR